MVPSLGSTFDTRLDQMFPVLHAAEIGRLRRFGERRGFLAGERLVAGSTKRVAAAVGEGA